jgi:hypothetical protein
MNVRSSETSWGDELIQFYYKSFSFLSLAPLLHTQVVTGSNLSPETCYPDRCLCDLPWSLQANALNEAINISFHILSNSLLTNHPIIWYCIISATKGTIHPSTAYYFLTIFLQHCNSKAKILGGGDLTKMHFHSPVNAEWCGKRRSFFYVE